MQFIVTVYSTCLLITTQEGPQERTSAPSAKASSGEGVGLAAVREVEITTLKGCEMGCALSKQSEIVGSPGNGWPAPRDPPLGRLPCASRKLAQPHARDSEDGKGKRKVRVGF